MSDMLVLAMEALLSGIKWKFYIYIYRKCLTYAVVRFEIKSSNIYECA